MLTPNIGRDYMQSLTELSPMYELLYGDDRAQLSVSPELLGSGIQKRVPLQPTFISMESYVLVRRAGEFTSVNIWWPFLTISLCNRCGRLPKRQVLLQQILCGMSCRDPKSFHSDTEEIVGQGLQRPRLGHHQHISCHGRWRISRIMMAFDSNLVTQNKVSLDVKLDQILRWVDLPFEQRPQLIMGKHNNQCFNPFILNKFASIRTVPGSSRARNWTLFSTCQCKSSPSFQFTNFIKTKQCLSRPL